MNFLDKHISIINLYFYHKFIIKTNFQTWSSNEIIPLDMSLDPSTQDMMPANRNNLDVAIAFTNSLAAIGGTNINSAMIRGLELAKKNIPHLPQGTHPMHYGLRPIKSVQ